MLEFSLNHALLNQLRPAFFAQIMKPLRADETKRCGFGHRTIRAKEMLGALRRETLFLHLRIVGRNAGPLVRFVD